MILTYRRIGSSTTPHWKNSTPPVDSRQRPSGEWVNDYGGGRVYDIDYLPVAQLYDGNGETRYYAEPLEAPEWRERWVERMEP
jgi:hypothetical protein